LSFATIAAQLQQFAHWALQVATSVQSQFSSVQFSSVQFSSSLSLYTA